MNKVLWFGIVSCLAVYVTGCAICDERQYVMMRAAFGSSGCRYQILPWPEISDWLVTGEDHIRPDGACGYECFLDKAIEPDICVNLAPCFDCHEPIEVMTVYCENGNHDVFLPVKGFPPYCKGVHLDGHFDLSKVRIGKDVECFNLCDVMIVGVDSSKMLPDFTEAESLRYLDLRLSGDEYEGIGQVPLLDIARFSGLEQLTNLSICADCLIGNINKLSVSESLRKISIESNFTVSESEDVCFGTTVECEVDDSSFDEFIKRDFSDVERLEVKIDLKKTRTWDISSLANKRLDLISINAKNCWVTGMESFRRSKGLTWFGVTMEFESPGESEH